MEIWRDIPGYEGLYRVSNLGRVNELMLGVKKLRIDTGGYVQTSLYKKKTTKFFRVHRLVALAFIPNPQNKPQVNHIDGNKTNNCVSNLEWVTARENNLHAIRTGLRKAKTKA